MPVPNRASNTVRCLKALHCHFTPNINNQLFNHHRTRHHASKLNQIFDTVPRNRTLYFSRTVPIIRTLYFSRPIAGIGSSIGSSSPKHSIRP
jgi:hypothetical protein